MLYSKTQTMTNEQKITPKARLLILSTLLIISSHIIYNLASTITYIGFNISLTDYPSLTRVCQYIVWIITPCGYFLLSGIVKNRAVKNILIITSAVLFLQSIIRYSYINLATSSSIIMALLQALAFLIGASITCYLWGAVKRNYNLKKKERISIDCYIAYILIISPMVLQIGNHILSFRVINTVIIIIELILLYKIITPAIFCAESKDISTQEQYRFWNKYHLWILIGLIGNAITSAIIINI